MYFFSGARFSNRLRIPKSISPEVIQVPNVAPFLMDRIDWNLLRTYQVIMQEKSISRAAARLHLTQSAVSAALKRLEDTVGCTLVQRGGARFEPTGVGREIYQISTEIYGHMSRLDTVLGNQDDEIAGSIRLLCVSRLESSVYDRFLRDFHQIYPKVRISIDVAASADILAALEQKVATCGFTLCRKPAGKLEYRCFLRQRYTMYCGPSHRLFGQSNLTVGDLRDEHFVSFHSDRIGGALSSLAAFREERGLFGEIVATSASVDEIRRLIIAGYGIGCLPAHVVQGDVAQRRLWPLPPEEGLADVDIFLMWNPERRMNQAERAFIDALESEMAKHPLMARF